MTFAIKLWRLQTLVWLENGTEQPKWVQQGLMRGWLLKLSSPPCSLKEVIFGGKKFVWRLFSTSMLMVLDGFLIYFFFGCSKLLSHYMASIAVLRKILISQPVLHFIYLWLFHLFVTYKFGGRRGKISRKNISWKESKVSFKRSFLKYLLVKIPK